MTNLESVFIQKQRDAAKAFVDELISKAIDDGEADTIDVASGPLGTEVRVRMHIGKTKITVLATEES